jgi:hypothetical protein
VEIVAKGSCFCVTESTATARVEVSSLIKTSLFDCEWTFCEGLGRLKIKSAIANAGSRKRGRFPETLAFIKRAKCDAHIALPESAGNLSLIARELKRFSFRVLFGIV